MTRLLQVTPLDGYDPEIGRWLWALEDARRITREAVAGLSLAELDWRGPDGTENSIGSLLYHVAGAEMLWLFDRVRGTGRPDEVAAALPFPGWTDGAMTHVGGVPLAEHLDRLERTRSVFLREMRALDLEAYRRVRRPEGASYDVSAEWVVHHLIEHEVGHAYQMRSLRRRVGLRSG